MARKERESDKRRGEEKWQTCWCCRDQQKVCRMAQVSAENLEHTGTAEKERVASVPQREQSRLCQEKKEQSHLSRVPGHSNLETIWVKRMCKKSKEKYTVQSGTPQSDPIRKQRYSVRP